MISILGYGCSSAAGRGVGRFWQGLLEGRDHSRPLDTSSWGVPSREPVLACTWPDRGGSTKEQLVAELQFALSEIDLKRGLKLGLEPGAMLGVIFASSKGCLEDFIWTGDARSLERDPLAPCLTELVARSGLQPSRSLCLSNACASSHSALFLAAAWLEEKIVSDVLVLAADGIGPFVTQGFRSLSALSATRSRPFAQDRDGLRLGEAAAALWLSNRDGEGPRLLGTGLDVEGYAVTRPSESGASLRRAILQSFGGANRKPDLIIAHGTATAANDAAEDRTFVELFGVPTPFVTATKWSIGHTLGASGLMDIIAACEVLRERRVFRLANTEKIDESFRARYLLPVRVGVSEPGQMNEILVTSLGFGGVHAAVRIGATA